MSIDRYYTQRDGKRVCSYQYVVDDHLEFMPGDKRLHTDFWVDICRGANILVDERYYFSDLASALDFYSDGCRGRQFVDDDGKDVGLDHGALYSRGRLIHGFSIHGDAPGHEGEDLQAILGKFVRKMSEEETP